MADINFIGQQVQGYTIVQRLGSGGYGTVYLGIKEDLGKQYQTAVKYISLPDEEGYEAVLQDYSYDKTAVQVHFEKIIEKITAEINTLLDLSKKDNRYIVAYYDHEIRMSSDPLRYDIFMRMEYLTPLSHHIRKEGMTVGEVIKLGMHMCDALSLCHSNGIMHRDIKEANIFVNDSGNYKLGDFGVAKTAIETTRTGTIMGTASYMAPEIYLREPYNTSVDIYSLGIVLYKLLNNQRLPFMPPAPEPFTADDKNIAEARRLKGETPPLPLNAQNRLGEIIVRACAAKDERYMKAEDFRKDLQDFLTTLSEEECSQMVVLPVEESMEGTDSLTEDSYISYTRTQGATVTMAAQNTFKDSETSFAPSIDKGKPRKKKKKIFIVLGAVLAAAGVAGYFFISKLTNPLSLFQAAIEEKDFVKAAQLYQDKLEGNDSDEAAEAGAFILSQAEEVRVKYETGEMDYEDALNQLQQMEKLGAVEPAEIQQITGQINEMRTSRAAYESAINDMEAGKFEGAINNFRKVVQDDSNYDDAQTRLAEAIRSYKDGVIGNLYGFDADKRYDEAIDVLKEALITVPDDADLLEKIKDYEKKIEDGTTLEIDGIIREAENSVMISEDYETALSNLREACRKYPNREELETAIRETEEKYVDKALGEAESLALESEYEAAVALLNEASKLVTSNPEIKTAIAEYEARYPALLQQLTYFTGESLINGGQELDNMQQMQTNIVLADDKDNHFDNTYKLEGEYKRVTGVLYQPFERRSNKYIGVLEIFGDGRLLYSANMRGGFEPVAFEVELTGVSDFEIRLVNEWGDTSTYHGGYARLANVQLYQ